MAMFIVFSVLVACAHFYFFQWQVFVLKIDRLLNIICFIFVGLELILVSQPAPVSFPLLGYLHQCWAHVHLGSNRHPGLQSSREQSAVIAISERCL